MKEHYGTIYFGYFNITFAHQVASKSFTSTLGMKINNGKIDEKYAPDLTFNVWIQIVVDPATFSFWYPQCTKVTSHVYMPKDIDSHVFLISYLS